MISKGLIQERTNLILGTEDASYVVKIYFSHFCRFRFLYNSCISLQSYGFFIIMSVVILSVMLVDFSRF